MTSQCSTILPFSSRIAARIIRQAMPVAVQDDIVAVCEHTLDLAMCVRMIGRDPGDELPHALHAVFDERVVLAIGGAGIGLDDP